MSYKFTPLEWEIIKHRLEVGDAIAEVMLDDDEGPFYQHGAILDAVDWLFANGPKYERRLSDLEFYILRETCEGSTFFACSNSAVDAGDLNKDKLYRLNNAADILESMLNVSIPRA